MNTPDVKDNPEQSRYEIWLDGGMAGLADYLLRDGEIIFPHTEIDKDMRGRGLGEKLVAFAVADARARSLRITATCWFVREYLEKHPA